MDQDSRSVFSDDGSYYYIGNAAQKTRFIILNSLHGGVYLADGNGIVSTTASDQINS